LRLEPALSLILKSSRAQAAVWIVFNIYRPVFCVRTGDVEMGGDKGMN